MSEGNLHCNWFGQQSGETLPEPEAGWLNFYRALIKAFSEYPADVRSQRHGIFIAYKSRAMPVRGSTFEIDIAIR